MSAEVLREAATLMRERAEADGSRGWQIEDANEGTEYHPLWMVTNDAFHNPTANEDEPWLAVEVHTGTKATAEHIASWHPAVALAVADWLEATAADMDENTILDSPESGEYMPAHPEALWCEYCGGAIESPDYPADDQKCSCERWIKALAVVRAYLGDQS